MLNYPKSNILFILFTFPLTESLAILKLRGHPENRSLIPKRQAEHPEEKSTYFSSLNTLNKPKQAQLCSKHDMPLIVNGESHELPSLCLRQTKKKSLYLDPLTPSYSSASLSHVEKLHLHE